MANKVRKMRKAFRKMARSSRRAQRASEKKMRRIARIEIARQTEDKTVRGTANLPLGANPDNYLSFAANNVLDTSINLSTIAQGTGQGNRVGNRIKLTKFMLRGSLYSQNGIDQPQVVKIWVVTDKLDPYNGTSTDIKDACSTLASAPGSSWFQDGNGVTGLTSNLRDLQLPVNEDRFKVYCTRTFKVANSGAPAGNTPAGNNDFKALVNYKINLLKYHPKIIRYQDTYNAATFNRKLFVVYQCVAANGSTTNSTSAVVGHIRTLELKFEDA